VRVTDSLFDGRAVAQACFLLVEPLNQARCLMTGLTKAGLLFAISPCSARSALLSCSEK